MKPEIKKLWVEALRSGKYAQTKERLREGDCFCVLGVLCDLHSRQCTFPWRGNSYFEHDTNLPKPVREWSGLQSSGGAFVEINGITTILHSHNDKGRTFAEIADAIEEQL